MLYIFIIPKSAQAFKRCYRIQIPITMVREDRSSRLIVRKGCEWEVN
jgi:hypothetical protein